jgi:hypothetical protein
MFYFAAAILDTQEQPEKSGSGRGFKPSHPVHFLLRGNCGIKSRLLLEVVGQKLPIALLSLGSLKILRCAVTLLLEPSLSLLFRHNEIEKRRTDNKGVL